MDEQRLLVSVELGATIPIGETMGFVKPSLRISNIDPAGDVAEQVRRGLAAATVAFAEIDGKLEEVIADLIAPSTGQPSIGTRTEVLERGLETVRRNIKTIADKVKEQQALLAARAQAVVTEETSGGQAGF